VARDELDRMATNPAIHGKTRNKYTRIPRHNLLELLEALCRDGNMDRREHDFRDAIAMWNWHRNGKAPLTPPEVDRMKELASRVSHAPALRVVAR
jgi:hypothetical protein